MQPLAQRKLCPLLRANLRVPRDGNTSPMCPAQPPALLRDPLLPPSPTDSGLFLHQQTCPGPFGPCSKFQRGPLSGGCLVANVCQGAGQERPDLFPWLLGSCVENRLGVGAGQRRETRAKVTTAKPAGDDQGGAGPPVAMDAAVKRSHPQWFEGWVGVGCERKRGGMVTPRCWVPARWGAPRGAQVWGGSWGTESEAPARPPGEKLWLPWGLMAS